LEKYIGGGFGGKETDVVWFSCAAAVAAFHTKKPVRLVLERDEDMKWTGKRHSFVGSYKIAADEEGKFMGANMEMFCNAGNLVDTSLSVLERALFHSDNAYNFENFEVTGKLCKTNFNSNTAFRGFGGPQRMLFCETAIEHLAEEMGVRPEKLREKNLYKPEDNTHFGQSVDCRLPELWEECVKSSKFQERLEEIGKFNEKSFSRKKGISVVPAKFGISFTAISLNQGSALVHVYTDGTVLVTHGG
jgi:xanthine dehydrogenase/oxidase